MPDYDVTLQMILRKPCHMKAGKICREELSHDEFVSGDFGVDTAISLAWESAVEIFGGDGRCLVLKQVEMETRKKGLLRKTRIAPLQ